MNLLRSFCCLFGGRCAEEEPKPTQKECDVKRLVILAKRKVREKSE